MRRSHGLCLSLVALAASDGPAVGDFFFCAEGWTESQGTCFKYVTTMTTFSDANNLCAELRPGSTLATILNEVQNSAVAKLIQSSGDAWIGRRAEGGIERWMDNDACNFTPGWEHTLGSSGQSCARAFAAGHQIYPRWGVWDCSGTRFAVCGYRLPNAAGACEPDAEPCKWEALPGYCEPNGFAETLCSPSTRQGPQFSSTCEAQYAGQLPHYGDWSRETGFAYFHPSSCNEQCARARCDADASCKGYTLAEAAIDGQSAVSLKSHITGATEWHGYTCMRKVGASTSSCLFMTSSSSLHSSSTQSWSFFWLGIAAAMVRHASDCYAAS
eukprot:TRINITY_DN32881_c0_g1_i1.p1 TRINITY_DN32881_c0_g1~~TRINITY_DN32881_c0_g1_i1.p1  ORF type:complete len:338 (-),score=28.68 TRINITY_DN32881_c0_g1_i1:35-1018(-)